MAGSIFFLMSHGIFHCGTKTLVGVHELSRSMACRILVPRLGVHEPPGKSPSGVYFKTSHFGPATLPVLSGHLRLVATFEDGESKSSDK